MTEGKRAFFQEELSIMLSESYRLLARSEEYEESEDYSHAHACLKQSEYLSSQYRAIVWTLSKLGYTVRSEYPPALDAERVVITGGEK